MKGSEEQGDQVKFSKEIIYDFTKKKKNMSKRTG